VITIVYFLITLKPGNFGGEFSHNKRLKWYYQVFLFIQLYAPLDYSSLKLTLEFIQLYAPLDYSRLKLTLEFIQLYAPLDYSRLKLTL